MRLSERREVAIYLRKDALWVADFIDGHGELIDAATWFRFNCGTPTTSPARRRMILESAIPLSAQLVARLGYLHRSATTRQRGAAVGSGETLFNTTPIQMSRWPPLADKHRSMTAMERNALRPQLAALRHLRLNRVGC